QLVVVGAIGRCPSVQLDDDVTVVTVADVLAHAGARHALEAAGAAGEREVERANPRIESFLSVEGQGQARKPRPHPNAGIATRGVKRTTNSCRRRPCRYPACADPSALAGTAARLRELGPCDGRHLLVRAEQVAGAGRAEVASRQLLE